MERPEFDRLLTASLPHIERNARAYAARFNLLHEWRDIAQAALLKMLRYAGYYDPAKGEFMPWACVVIINTIKNRLNQVAAAPDMSEFNTLIIERTQVTGDPESDMQAAMLLDNLNAETRLYAEGYNYAEIAAKCGFSSKTTAKNRIDRCTARLRLMAGIDAAQHSRTRRYAKTPG